MATKGTRQKKADGPLVAALAAGMSVRAAAKRAGLAERTAYRRLDSPDFRRDVDKARREIISRATAKLAASSTKAADTLRKLLRSNDEHVRLAAARWTLRLLTTMLDHQELSDRVATLEARLLNGGKDQ